jgi:starvation-inducible DNA-binding protein
MEGLYKLLSDIQANLFILFHKTWIFHWNVIGSDFQQLHTLFGEQYEAMFGEIDRLTEHMRYLNVRPVGTLSRIVEVSTIGEGSNTSQIDEFGQKQIIPGKPVIKSDDMVKRLLADNLIFLELLTSASEVAGEQRSYATENILQDLMESHGKFVWMLRSITEKTPNVSVDDTLPSKEEIAQQQMVQQLPVQ